MLLGIFFNIFIFMHVCSFYTKAYRFVGAFNAVIKHKLRKSESDGVLGPRNKNLELLDYEL